MTHGPLLTIVRDDGAVVFIPLEYCGPIVLLALISPGGALARSILFDCVFAVQGGEA